MSPAFLKRDGDELTVSLGGLERDEFQDTLARVKSIPGRKWDGENKVWRLPADADTAHRAIMMIGDKVMADAEVQQIVKQRAVEVAEALLTKLPDDATDLSVPYATDLRPYQRSSIDFMARHERVILADEMGLGKTVQALAAVQEYAYRYGLPEGSSGRCLIVCPNAVRGVWSSEILKWLPGKGPDDIQVIDGKSAKTREQQVAVEVPFTIINWEKIRYRKKGDKRVPITPGLDKVAWLAVIADEAHRAKNKDAEQSKRLRKLRAPIQLALTGTPIMSSPSDLWPLLNWLDPESHNAYWPFHYSHVDEYPAAKGTIVTGVKNPDALRYLLKDILVRRTKEDVLEDLPDKTLERVPVTFTPAEHKLYAKVEEELILDLEKWASEKDSPLDIDELFTMPLERLQGLVPNMGARITKLRQITSAAKGRAVEEIIRDNPQEPQVAFAWYVDTVMNLKNALEKGKPAYKVGAIAGDADPEPIVEDFQDGHLDHVVGTITKGGVGLTLTRSSVLHMVDEDWVPAINMQAHDRVHRIGQDRPVTIYTYYVPDTVDTKHVAPKNRLKELITTAVLGERE